MSNFDVGMKVRVHFNPENPLHRQLGALDAEFDRVGVVIQTTTLDYWANEWPEALVGVCFNYPNDPGHWIAWWCLPSQLEPVEGPW